MPVSAIRESAIVESVEGGATELDVVIDSFSFIDLLLAFIVPPPASFSRIYPIKIDSPLYVV